MKVHLLAPDRDIDSQPSPRPFSQQLSKDLELATLLAAMADGDEFVLPVATNVVLAAVESDLDTIQYRQHALRDALANPEVVRQMYALAVDVAVARKRQWWSVHSRQPSSVLYSAIEALRMCLSRLTTLQRIAQEHAATFQSEAFRTLLAILRVELSTDYLGGISQRLTDLQFRDGVLMSVALGRGNEGIDYVLRKTPGESSRPFWQIFARRASGLSFRIDDRDEAGARAVGDLRDRGVTLVADALAQAAEHVLSFFAALQIELAFYVGCLNLHGELKKRGVAICFPSVGGALQLAGTDLRDACLVLKTTERVVGQAFDADARPLMIITGANQGGKSTFLRSLGVAQLMAQAGMFVAAESFRTTVCAGIFTHYKRDEDATLKRGKFDEELSRMDEIVEQIRPGALVLFNESFAATNEREGSEIARQIVRALIEHDIRVVFVTHLYDFALSIVDAYEDGALFLRADRGPDGSRPFLLQPGRPLPTSFGIDVYDEVFGNALTQ